MVTILKYIFTNYKKTAIFTKDIYIKFKKQFRSTTVSFKILKIKKH